MTSASGAPDEDGAPAGAAAGPELLPPNYVARFYRGGSRLGAFRGAPQGEFDGEDWVGSTTRAYGGTDGLGLSRLASGVLLADAVAADPVGYLGPAHKAAFGAGTELLVKLLDAGERLAVHYHPSRGFAREHLGCAHGKTEAWLVLTAPQDGAVHLGFAREVGRDELRGWVRDQDAAAMLAAMNRIAVGPGDAVLVPAGVPHAIGAGIFLVELQEPTDWSLMLERGGPEAPEESPGWRLGLGVDVALSAVDRGALGAERLAALRLPAPVPLAPGVERLLPEAADPYFRAQGVAGPAVLEPSLAVVVGTEGELRLTPESGRALDLPAGRACLVPFAAGRCTVSGGGRAIRCLPPLPG
ncbi:carbohydrate kinase [Streptomyces sp. NPDC050560]|uniref:carbohydrate kinase n=1 Tax=Streptomyces sp. NPDC050560 TaxID=3365630 RepID=UPI00379C73BA